jgi:CheY-like chemotaxis protein
MTSILIVEDDVLTSEYLEFILQQAGYEVVSATSADEAAALLEGRDDVQLIVTDINLPGSMNGLKLAAAVKARRPAMNIIIVTGYGAPKGDKIPPGSLFGSKTIQCPKDDRGNPAFSVATPSTQHPGAMDRREQTPPNPYRACQEALVRKIQSGDLDIGCFYSVETTDAGFTAIDLPAGITPKRPIR